MTHFMTDLRYGARTLRKAPGLSAAAILTLGLGIGASTAVVAVAYGVLLRPLPYRDPESLIVLEGQPPPANPSATRFAFPELADWIDRSRTLESMALHSDDLFAVSGDTGLEPVAGARVSARFFDTVGNAIAAGRALDATRPGEVVIGHDFWQRHLHGDPGVLGRTLRLNDQPHTIVGIARPEFRYPLVTTEVWTSVESAGPRFTTNRRNRLFGLVARLKPGVTVDQAAADADAVAKTLARDYAEASDRVSARAISLHERISGRVRPALVLLLAAVGLVLIVACANVANLLLVRQASRAHEAAVRTALGASRGRLIGQSIAESLLLGAAAGAIGLATARVLTSVLLWAQPVAAFGLRNETPLPRVDAIHLDSPVLLVGVAISVLSAVLAGVASAVQFAAGARHTAARRGLADTLRGGSPARGATPATRRLRSSLVIAQLAACLMLLVGATLLGRSLARLLQTDIGATRDRVLTAELNLAMGRALGNADQIALADRIIEAARRLPDVEAVGASSVFPLRGVRMVFSFARTTASGPQEIPLGMVNPTRDYFRALGIPLLKGRLFTDADGATTPQVAILSASAARRFFGADDPLGRPLYGKGPTVVGIVGDVKYGKLQDEGSANETLYRPFAQQPFRSLFVTIRTSGDPSALARELRPLIHGIDPAIMIGPARTLDEILSDVVAEPRLRAMMLAAIAGLALVLAAVGLYGVVSGSVSRRTHEIGVRMALGADRRDVTRMIVRETAILAAFGLALGALGAISLSRLLTRFLYGVTPGDAMSFAAAAGVLVAVMALATYAPVRRATSIDPSVALRVE